MKFFKLMKDGGAESRVWGYFLVEIKSLFTIALLHFKDGSRDAFHSHAFNAISWQFTGKLFEVEMCDERGNRRVNIYRPSFKPIITPRSMFHKVVSEGDTWVLTFRGPWIDRWKEYLPAEKQYLTLTHGREIVDKQAA